MTNKIAIIDEEALNELKNSYPIEQSYQRKIFPRIGMVSQDKTEKVGKTVKLVAEAGMFYTEVQTDEVDENEKKVYKKTDLGESMEGIIIFERKQLKFYDQPNNTFTSSPIFDNPEEIIPLFSNKQEVDRGTPKELKSRKKYQGLTAGGRPTSKLMDVRILYVIVDGTLYQMDLQGSSGYAFGDYKKKVQHPNTVLTVFNSEAKENGATKWNQMTFINKRPLKTDEVAEVLTLTREIINGLASEKAYYSQPLQLTEDQKIAKAAVDNF